MPHMGLILSSAKSTKTGEEDQETHGVSAPLGCSLFLHYSFQRQQELNVSEIQEIKRPQQKQPVKGIAIWIIQGKDI